MTRPTSHITLKLITCLFICFSLSLSGLANSTEANTEQSLKQLYSDIKQERSLQKKADKERESSFRQQKNNQNKTLSELKEKYTNKKKELEKLKVKITDTAKTINETKRQLAESSHALKDLFSVWRQAVKDGKSNMQASKLYHQYPDKLVEISDLSAQTALPDTQDLQSIFTLLQHDIKQGRQSLSYKGILINESGESEQKEIQRIGTFSSTSEGKFLIHDPKNNSLIALPTQPDSNILDAIENDNYINLKDGTTINAVIDPSSGMLLEQLALVPSWKDRFHQGGQIGYLIVLIGCLGILLSLARWCSITYSQLAIKRQMKTPSNIDTRNPLGRILYAYQENTKHKQNERRKGEKLDTETLEVQLEEIVVSEMPKLDKGLGTIKLLAAIAPLLGLLGTVVGMINTFQSITLVGNADPKLMAGGISQALMTTVMGLLVAVPLLFSHNLLTAKTKRVLMFLTQQSLGFIVKYMQSESTNPALEKEK